MTPTACQEQQSANNNVNAPAASTLIEFPTPGRAPKPPWRKELSERVREIQQRKAQEAAREAEAAASASPIIPTPTPQPDAPEVPAPSTDEPATPALGLVPPQPTPEMNPLVVAALKRIERAHRPNAVPPMRGSSRRAGRTAAAVARVTQEDYQVAVEPVVPRAAAPVVVASEPQPVQSIAQTATEQVAQPEQSSSSPLPIQNTQPGEPLQFESPQVESRQVELPQVEPHEAESPDEAPRPANLVVVQTQEPPQTEPAQAGARPKARRHIPLVLDDAYLARREAAELAAAASAVPGPDDYAPALKRVVGSFIDLLVVGFAATPFAAIIELTNGNWDDPRVAGSFGGIVVLVLFLYLMASTALAGRTWGMSLVALRTVDASTGCAPTTSQCVRRALGYILALATGGLGFLYAFVNAERRALHDYLSGTIIVRE